jgi:D-alanyl-D-alanine carboxypeptidase (penicillin-binding protein 5/6)
MTYLNKLLILVFSILFISTPVVQADVMPVPAPPQVPARNYILVDYDSGKVLAEKGADKKIEPASITKLMTAYVVYQEVIAGRLKMSDKVTISKKAWHTGGSRMFVKVGSQVTVEELLKGLIIDSGNDAAVALAEHVGGTEDAFVQLMNQYAAKLGMTNTHFVNATGLPNPDHLTTARDIATLTAAVIRYHSAYYGLYAQKVLTYNHIKQYNRNKLLWHDSSVDGLKTGHTESAGYCLVASAKRGDMRLISVVLGTDSDNARASVSQSLLNYGFRFYETHKLYGAGDKLSSSRVWYGDNKEVTLGLDHDMYVTIPRGSYKSLDASLNVNSKIDAPVRKGASLGTVDVKLGSKDIAKAPLVALQNIDEGSLFQRARDYVLSLFN